jgi:plasmid maintenance system antidote protein VapI
VELSSDNPRTPQLAEHLGAVIYKLARYFGTSPRFWLGLQSDYDLDAAEDLLGDRLAREVRPMAALG